jgi:hypothetical protein
MFGNQANLLHRFLGRSAVQKTPHPSSAFSLLLLTLTLKIGRFMHPLTEAESALSM